MSEAPVYSCFEIHNPSTVTVRLRDAGPGAAVGVSANHQHEFIEPRIFKLHH